MQLIDVIGVIGELLAGIGMLGDAETTATINKPAPMESKMSLQLSF
jgi:hypothetical protein